MSKWRSWDIGKIIVYREELPCTNNLMNREVAIYDVCSRVPNTIRVIECPIPLDDYPVSLKSKISLTGMIKCNEKKGEEYLEKAGDWYFKRYVSKEEKKVLKKVAKDLKVYLD